MFLGAIVAASAFSRVDFTLADSAAYLVGLRALATLPSLAAAVLAILVVRTITLRQQARLAALV